MNPLSPRFRWPRPDRLAPAIFFKSRTLNAPLSFRAFDPGSANLGDLGIRRFPYLTGIQRLDIEQHKHDHIALGLFALCGRAVDLVSPPKLRGP